jgi:RNA polymerase primary sigma factor
VERRELILVRVSDSGTTGLVGEETGTGNFAALCRNNLDSEKLQPTAGGSYGLGKAVLWRMSQLSTVLFSSNPVPLDDEPAESWRFIGRSELGWHEQGGHAFAGPGWLGRQNDVAGPPAISFWGNRALARDLHLDRAPDDLGTSILVVGFDDPSTEEELTPAEIASQIAQASAAHFWPILAEGRLVVTVENAEGETLESSTKVDVAQLQPSFADAITKHNNNEVVDRLRDPGDVVRVSLDLELPACLAEGQEHPAMTHKPILLVRLASDDDASANLRSAALSRGAGMVVEYVNLERVSLGARPFHAAVLCGKAAGVDKPALNAELFLRTAEPPAHNRWDLTPALKRNYARGSWKALRDFHEQIKQEVRKLVAPIASDVSDGPQALKELLRITPEPPAEKMPRVSRASGEPDADGRWEVEATIRVPATDVAWRGEPVLLFTSESHGGRPVEWERLEAISNCKVIDGHLVIPPGKTSAKFRGWANREKQPVPAKYATVIVDFRRPEKIMGEAI